MTTLPIRPKKKPVPLGQPIQWTNEELDDLSQITPADIEAAKQLWEQGAPVQYKNLLDAQPEQDADNANPNQRTNA